MNLQPGFSLARAWLSPLQLLTAGFSGLVDTPSQRWEREQESGQPASSKLELLGEKSFLTEFARRQSQPGPRSLERGGTGPKEERVAGRPGSPAEPPPPTTARIPAARDRDRGTAAAEPPSSVSVRAGFLGWEVGNRRPGWVKDQISVATRVRA